MQDSFNDKEILSLIEKNNIKYKFASKKEIDHLVDGVHQGILLYVSDYKYSSLDDLINNEDYFCEDFNNSLPKVNICLAYIKEFQSYTSKLFLNYLVNQVAEELEN